MRDFQEYMTRFISVFILLLCTAAPVYAQSGGLTGASFRTGFSARAMAMSNAMTANSFDGSYAYYNPAFAALKSEKVQLDLSAGALSYDRVFQSTGASFQLPPTAGLSVYLLRTGVNDIDGRTQSGYPTGSFDAGEYQLSTNFGIRLNDNVSGGIGIKFSMADYHEDVTNPVAVGIDLGLLVKTGSHIQIGLAVQDLLATYTWDSGNLYNLDQSQSLTESFPTRLKAGIAWKKQKFTVSGDLELMISQSEITTYDTFIDNGRPVLIPETESVSSSVAMFRLGGSWQAHERLTLRGGWNLPDATDSNSWGLSSGFSVHLPFDMFSPSVDYAFVLEPYRISNMHVFSLRLNL